MAKVQSVLLLAAALLAAQFGFASEVTVPPRELVAAWKLSPVYTKHTSVEGLPVLGSANVSDYAVNEAVFLIKQMVGQRPEILHAMASNRVRFVIMAVSEMTTDVPEHSDLTPKSYWNRRARGLGATKARPAVSCGEENLLCLPGDPYAAENILIHEFAHAIHEMGLSVVDPTFDKRLRTAYENAKAAGLWKGTYAMQNRSEYWAEAAQSWFDCNRVNDKEHGPIDTRDKLKPYDPEVAKLLTEVFGDKPWRYSRPAKRPAAERAHLAGFDVTKAGRFAWPKEATNLETQGELLAWLAPDKTPAASPRGGSGKETSILFVNRRAKDVSLAWVDFDGGRKSHGTVRPGLTSLMNTFPGHVFVVSEGERLLGAVAAAEAAGRAEIKPDSASATPSAETKPPASAKASHQQRKIAGWTVHIHERLLAEQKDDTEKMLQLLTAQLKGIIRVVPAHAVERLQKVPLWISPEYPGVKPRAEYHPGAAWLRANGRDPVMVKSVEFTDVRNFEREVIRMPVVVLHELAHAYHDQVFGFDHAEIKAAYEHAKASGSYDKVERWFGNGRPNTFERAYAMTNPQEYFAETTEAFFGRNDFFPFTRDELEKHDPEMFKLLQKLWNSPVLDNPPKRR